MTLKKIKKSLLGILILTLSLGSQSELEQKAALQDEKDILKQKVKEEKEYFAKFQKEKENLLRQKSSELNLLDQEIESYAQEIDQLKREMREIELKLKRIKQNNERINQAIKQAAQELVTSIEVGIPFDRDRRKATLNTLIMDIESGKSTAAESFGRLMTFLNSEELLGFDSQTLEKSIKIGDNYLPATILRIGRVCFAAQTEKDVYLYKKEGVQYLLDEETKLDFTQRRNIDLAIKIIQGKKPPKMIALPFYTKDIIKEGASK